MDLLSPDHDLQILHQDQCGYVVRCRHCGCMQVAFNNLAIDQDKFEFQSLARVVQLYCQDHQHKEGVKIRDIFLDTPFEKLRLVFSYPELYAFHNMLQKVNLILQAEDRGKN